MNASKELIEAFEGIGFKKEFVSTMGNNIGNYLIPTIHELQSWLWKEKGLSVDVALLQTLEVEFGYDIMQRFKKGSNMFAVKGDVTLRVHSAREFSTPSEALSDGLMKAVEIVKERNNND